VKRNLFMCVTGWNIVLEIANPTSKGEVDKTGKNNELLVGVMTAYPLWVIHPLTKGMQ